MPYTVTNPDQLINRADFSRTEFNYDYPNDLKLKPGDVLHTRLLSRLMRYGWESARVISKRRPAWHEMNDKLCGYIKLSEKERAIKDADPRKPVSIVFPYTYAILETLVAYNVAAFLLEPVFRYEGVAPEDVAGATLLERVITLHVLKNKVGLNLHTMFRDAGAYGMGIVSPQWITKVGKRIRSAPLGAYDGDGYFTETGRTRVVEDEVLFEGNSLVNIDPFYYLPDPNFPLHDVQRGEYVGWLDKSNYMDLLSEEQRDEDLFNVRYLKLVNNKRSTFFGVDADGRVNRDTVVPNNRNISDPIDLLHMYVKLIPREWELGRSELPEKWLFTVGGDAVIIRAKSLGLHHDEFPVCITAPDFDGYSPVAYSRLEILSGMQTTIDWLFNSHIANVRKAINDRLIVDPFLINVADLKDSEPGGIVRLRRPAWGKGVQNAVQQLSIVDITRANIGDVQFLVQYMQQVAGTDNPVMGNLRRGGPDRLSAREYQGTTQGALNRLERVGKIIGLQSMQDIGNQFAYNAQQFMTNAVYVRTVGEWPQRVLEQFGVDQNRVRVRPEDILVAYDLITRDGSVPGGNFSDSWIQIFDIIGRNEALTSRFDVVRIFEYIATNLGAKNVAEFRTQPPQVPSIQPTVVPDETVERELERGNLLQLLGT